MKNAFFAVLAALACLASCAGYAETGSDSNATAPLVLGGVNTGVFVPQGAAYSIVNFTSGGGTAYAVISDGNVYAIFLPGILGHELTADNARIEAALSDYYKSLGLSPDSVDQFEAVHFGITELNDTHEEGAAKCRILLGTDTRECFDFDSCQKACYAVTSFCQPVALGAGREFINLIWEFENATAALEDAYDEEEAFFALFNKSKTRENMAAYLLSLERINRVAGAASQSRLYTDYSYCFEPDYSLPEITSLQLSAQRLYNSASPFFSISAEAKKIRDRTLEGLQKASQPEPPAVQLNVSENVTNSSGIPEAPPAAAPSWAVLAMGGVILIVILAIGAEVFFFAKRRRKGL